MLRRVPFCFSPGDPGDLLPLLPFLPLGDLPPLGDLSGVLSAAGNFFSVDLRSAGDFVSDALLSVGDFSKAIEAALPEIALAYMLNFNHFAPFFLGKVAVRGNLLLVRTVLSSWMRLLWERLIERSLRLSAQAFTIIT